MSLHITLYLTGDFTESDVILSVCFNLNDKYSQIICCCYISVWISKKKINEAK